MRLLAVGGGAAVVLYIATSLLSGSREAFLNRASVSMLEGYVNQNPRDSEAAFRLAFKLVEDGKDGRAQSIMERLVRGNPRSALFHYGLGTVMHARGCVSASFPEFQTAIKLDPRLSKGYLSIASISSSAGLYTEALPAYKQAESQGMDIGDDIVGWARAQVGVGNYQAAWERLVQQFEKTPAADVLYPLATEAGLKLKRYSELESLLMRRLKMTRMYSVLPVRTSLIRVLLAQHPSPIVLHAVEKLAQDGFTIQGVDADFLAANAEVLMALNKRAQARKSLADGLKLSPDNVRCLELMATLERQSGNPARAAVLQARANFANHLTPEVVRCRKRVAALPRDAAARKALADALLSAGDPAGANEEYHRAQSIDPTMPELTALLDRTRVEALRRMDKANAANNRNVHPNTSI
jgi:tetratricopeptide (TPR) repeat protein